MIGATTMAVGFLGLLVLGMLILAGLVVGLVLLIIGLLRRQRAMWVAGLIVGTLCLLLLVGGLGLALRLARRASTAASSLTAAAPAAPMTAAIAGANFTRVTGLPAGFDCEWTSSAHSVRNGRLVVHIDCGGLNPGQFREFLRQHFRPTTWEKMKGEMDSPDGLAAAGWADEDLAAAAHYLRSHTDADGTRYVCYLAYDDPAGTAFIVAREVRGADDGTAEAPEAPARD